MFGKFDIRSNAVRTCVRVVFADHPADAAFFVGLFVGGVRTSRAWGESPGPIGSQLVGGGTCTGSRPGPQRPTARTPWRRTSGGGSRRRLRRPRGTQSRRTAADPRGKSNALSGRAQTRGSRGSTSRRAGCRRAVLPGARTQSARQRVPPVAKPRRRRRSIANDRLPALSRRLAGGSRRFISRLGGPPRAAGAVGPRPVGGR
jgi:hypothetical protein